ncbi:MAG: EAL domain-containing protein [Bradyrhizobiaceae bacterium]|nr:EAL domain-containing protein [Bradyrhizobiaceae bacterium]
MALIAASVGAVLHVALAMPLMEAGLISLAFLFALMTLEVAAGRRRDRAEFIGRLESVARAATDIAREVGELRHRVIALEGRPVPDLRAATAPLVREIGDLAELIEDVARTVTIHDALLASREAAPAVAPAEVPPLAPSRPVAETNGALAGRNASEVQAAVREAVEAGRIELYLQPVVTLPQRKVRHYEALSRMRLQDESVIEAARFLPAARAAGLMPKIDERLMQNCVQVVRRLAAKNREIGLFLNIAPETLADRATFAEILGLLDANRALASSLVLEFPQSAYRSMPPLELNSLSMLAERGFRFSLDRIEDFRIDPRGLAERGVRFLKVPADLMLRQAENATGHIHPADLSDLLGRYGIDLVADHIENESIVVDLLDLDVRYGQGYLFAQPRPVRAEVLQSERETAASAADFPRVAGRA